MFAVAFVVAAYGLRFAIKLGLVWLVLACLPFIGYLMLSMLLRIGSYGY